LLLLQKNNSCCARKKSAEREKKHTHLQCFFSVIASISPIITSSYILQSNSSSSMQNSRISLSHNNVELPHPWKCLAKSLDVCVCVSLSLCLCLSQWCGLPGHIKMPCKKLCVFHWQQKKWQEHLDCVKAVIFQTSSLNSQSPHKFWVFLPSK
jgi:hypothetical protein